MTDDRDPVHDDDLDTRVLAGLALLAREAGEPPLLTAARPARLAARSRHHTARLLVPAAVVLIAVVAAGLAYALTRSDPDQQVSTDDPTATPQGSESLIGTRWWLTDVQDRGTEVVIPTEGTRSLELRFLDGGSCEGFDGGCYDGLRVEGSDACNGVSRKMTIEGDTVELGEDYGVHTAMGCTDDLSTVLESFFRADRFSYAIDGEELVLTSADGEVVLTYGAIDMPFGPTSSLVVVAGEEGDQSHRLVWEDGGLEHQVVDTATGTGGGVAGVGVDPGRVNAMRSEVAGSPYLFGIVPANTARVVYEPAGSEPEEIEVIDIGDAESAVIGQFVQAAPDSWDLVAYDAAGDEIHRLRWNPQS